MSNNNETMTLKFRCPAELEGILTATGKVAEAAVFSVPHPVKGSAIVCACVEAGTDYVDISGEAEFMERMEAKYQDAAVAAKVLLVSACASVSIVSDIGLQHHLRSWPHQSAEAPPPSSVFSYVRIHSFASNHVASAETGFLALANAAALARFRRSLPRRPPLQVSGSYSFKHPLHFFLSSFLPSFLSLSSSLSLCTWFNVNSSLLLCADIPLLPLLFHCTTHTRFQGLPPQWNWTHAFIMRGSWDTGQASCPSATDP